MEKKVFLQAVFSSVTNGGQKYNCKPHFLIPILFECRCNCFYKKVHLPAMEQNFGGINEVVQKVKFNSFPIQSHC